MPFKSLAKPRKNFGCLNVGTRIADGFADFGAHHFACVLVGAGLQSSIQQRLLLAKCDGNGFSCSHAAKVTWPHDIVIFENLGNFRIKNRDGLSFGYVELSKNDGQP